MGTESLQSFWKAYVHKYAQNPSYFYIKVIQLTNTMSKDEDSS